MYGCDGYDGLEFSGSSDCSTAVVDDYFNGDPVLLTCTGSYPTSFPTPSPNDPHTTYTSGYVVYNYYAVVDGGTVCNTLISSFGQEIGECIYGSIITSVAVYSTDIIQNITFFDNNDCSGQPYTTDLFPWPTSCYEASTIEYSPVFIAPSGTPLNNKYYESIVYVNNSGTTCSGQIGAVNYGVVGLCYVDTGMSSKLTAVLSNSMEYYIYTQYSNKDCSGSYVSIGYGMLDYCESDTETSTIYFTTTNTITHPTNVPGYLAE